MPFWWYCEIGRTLEESYHTARTYIPVSDDCEYGDGIV